MTHHVMFSFKWAVALCALASVTCAVRVRIDQPIHELVQPAGRLNSKLPNVQLVQKRAAAEFGRIMQRGFIDVSDDGVVTLTRLHNHVPTDICKGLSDTYTPADCLAQGAGYKVQRNEKDVLSVVEKTLRDLKAVLKVVGVEKLVVDGFAGGLYAEGRLRYREDWVDAWKAIAKKRADNLVEELELGPKALAVTSTSGTLAGKVGVQIHITSLLKISALRSDEAVAAMAGTDAAKTLDIVGEEARAALNLKDGGEGEAAGAVLQDIVMRAEGALRVSSSREADVLQNILAEASAATKFDNVAKMSALTRIVKEVDKALNVGLGMDTQSSDDEAALEDVLSRAAAVLDHGNIKFKVDETLELSNFSQNQIPFTGCNLKFTKDDLQVLKGCISAAAIKPTAFAKVNEAMADIAELAALLGTTDLEIVGHAGAISEKNTQAATKIGKINDFKAGLMKLAAARAIVLVDLLLHQQPSASMGEALEQSIQDMRGKMAACVGSNALGNPALCQDVTAFGLIGVKIRMKTAMNSEALSKMSSRRKNA